mmetsp:Transcript_13076/g.9118  ORF Transcript_13076/g.9118 Transcript_13076/m.9118 type:complete len:130 (-) Transcript_13076:197-586(-)
MFKQKIDEPFNGHPLKATAVKAIKSQICELYPEFGEKYLDEVWPKKAECTILKIKGEAFVQFYKVNEDILFMEVKHRPIVPMLKLLHKYPFIMKKMQCDQGAIKHILTGSNVMAPGLTSAGGKMDDVEA